LKIVSHNALDTEVYDLRPADYTITTTRWCCHLVNLVII